MIEAVLFDLDDTLFDQRLWLSGAWEAVADVGVAYGVDRACLARALAEIAAEGSDRGHIIDRALARLDLHALPVEPFVAAFRAWRPSVELPLWPGARSALAALRRHLPIGLVTDGDPYLQRAKLTALGIGDAFDVAVFSDELGRSLRKPHPAPFHQALERLGTKPSASVYIGDRPEKDIAGAQKAGMRAIRVRTGEYAHAADSEAPWASAPDVVAAIELIWPMLPRPAQR